MGTNYYRVPKSSEINERYQKLNLRIQELDLWNPSIISREYKYIKHPDNPYMNISPWDEFIDGTHVHLGKRSGGWKFIWNFHDNKYYSNREDLIKFVRSGRVVNEYGDQLEPQEFLDMAFNWEQPNGLVGNKEYYDANPLYWISDPQKYYDKEIDGLIVSSSTEFC